MVTISVLCVLKIMMARKVEMMWKKLTNLPWTVAKSGKLKKVYKHIYVGPDTI